MLLKTIEISPLDMVQLVALLLGLPLLAGMWVRHIRPEWARKAASVLKYLALVFFMGLVVMALLQNLDIFYQYIGMVFIIVVMHNLIALSTGYSLARLTRLSRADRRSITLETGIQNSGLGLLLVFTFFDGLGGMAILVAFWGIWHLISGLLLAGFWSVNSGIKTQTS